MNKTMLNINLAHTTSSPFLAEATTRGLNNNLLPSSSKVDSRHIPVMTKEWTNGIYSFNNNYIKNIASADNTVNKIIKSFFTINPLSNNPNGKKTKLLKRRYKRLSLNRILVSKPEIKHDNNEVLVTVYLFNKKKISLLKNLHMQSNEMHNLDQKTKAISSPYTRFSKGLRKHRNKKIGTVGGKRNLRSTRKPVFYSKLLSTRSKSINNIFNKLALKTKVKSSPLLNFLEKNKRKGLKFYSSKFYYSRRKLRRLNYNKSVISKFIKNKYTLKNRYILPLKNKTSSKRRYYRKFALVTRLKRKYITYKNLNNLTRNKIYKFINSIKYTLALKNHSNLEKLLKSYYGLSSKYRLLNKDMSLTPALCEAHDINFTLNDTQINKSKPKAKNLKPLMHSKRKVYKLKTLYKLFLLSDNLNYLEDSYSNTPSYYTSLILNLYKLLNKTGALRLKVTTKKRNKGKALNLHNKLEKSTLNNVEYRLLKKLLLTHNNNSYIKIKSIARNNKKKVSYQRITKINKNVVLINKIKRIDRFADRYNNIMLKSIFNNKSSHAGFVSDSPQQEIARNYIQNLALSFKFRYLKDILHKEIMYLYYIKLLSYNNTLFKSWFLTPLRNIISKIYNKKVVLNLINLKYIHLNSDILLQAIALRLRNIKKNKLNKVLIKALALVKLSKVNAYARDINSPIYSYVEQHFNKFKNLNSVIFNDITSKNDVNNIITTSGISPTRSAHAYVPISTKWLNDAQTNTINLIKYKTVFGIKLEASGRLTKRSTASRAIFKFRYKGGLKNNPVISRDTSSTIIKSNIISNLQYTKVSSKTRNGSFGLKSWINNN